MPHVRQTIREAIKAALAGLTTTGDRVFSGYESPYDDASLPNLSVYVAKDPETVIEGEPETMGNFDYRELPVEIAARAKAGTGLEDTLDDICSEVEAALATDAGVKALTIDFRLTQTEIEMDSEAEKPVGVARMGWVLTYKVNRTAPVPA